MSCQRLTELRVSASPFSAVTTASGSLSVPEPMPQVLEAQVHAQERPLLLRLRRLPLIPQEQVAARRRFPGRMSQEED